MRRVFRITPALAAAVVILLMSAILSGVDTWANTPKAQDSKAAQRSAGTTGANQSPGDAYLEDFTALPLAKSNLKMISRILGQKDDDASQPFIRERWQVIWRAGDPMDLYIIKPRNVEKPPVILYLYGWPADTDRFKQDHWCGVVAGRGYAAIGLVSAYTGHRMLNHPLSEDFFNQLPVSLVASVHDVQMILNYLESRNEFDMSRVAMFGQGSGGAIAILTSAVDPRLKVLDVLSPWGDWPTFLEKSTAVPQDDRPKVTTPEFLQSVAGLDPLQWFPKVKAQSVRLEDIRKDGHMPDAGEEAMEAAAPAIAEIDQFGDTEAMAPVAAGGALLNWTKDQLKPDAKPQVALAKSERVHYFPPKADPHPLSFGGQKN